MITGQQQAAAVPVADISRTVQRYQGEVVYIYAYNVAHEMTREPLTKVFGQPVAQFGVDGDKRSPNDFCFTNRKWCGCRTSSELVPRARCG